MKCKARQGIACYTMPTLLQTPCLQVYLLDFGQSVAIADQTHAYLRTEVEHDQLLKLLRYLHSFDMSHSTSRLWQEKAGRQHVHHCVWTSLPITSTRWGMCHS